MTSRVLVLSLLLFEFLDEFADGIVLKAAKSRVIDLLQAVARPQSSKCRSEVEKCIEDLRQSALARPRELLRPIAEGSYRTIWTSVSADSVIGSLLRQRPSNIAGGDSWQVVSRGLVKAENIVYWPLLDTRMIGEADISAFNSKGEIGYELTIRGLRFSWGSKGVPEADFNSYISKQTANTLVILSLKQSEQLPNGSGRLAVLFNDGTLRITSDSSQRLTYVHLKEPLPVPLAELYGKYV